ncbi:MAG TPA: hypothetical protein VF101_01860 [Gaiellaceae bacterium]
MGGYTLYGDDYDADDGFDEGAEEPGDEELFGELEAETDENVLRNALRLGERNENRLTDLIFFNQHPERVDPTTGTGKLIEMPAESALAAQWRAIRSTMVRPALAATLAPVPPVVPILLAALPRHAAAFSVPADDLNRMRCVLTKLSKPGPDELVLLRDPRTGFQSFDAMRRGRITGPKLLGLMTFIRKQLTNDGATWRGAGISDVSMVEEFRRKIDGAIKANADWIVSEVITPGPGGRVDPGIRDLASFISGGHGDPNSIYSCYDLVF